MTDFPFGEQVALVCAVSYIECIHQLNIDAEPLIMPPKKMNKLEPVLLNNPPLETMKLKKDEQHMSNICIFFSYLDLSLDF